jgi:hypothetical protein
VPTVVEVINVALRLIGASRIASLTDGSKNANVAADIYESTRDELLAGHPWNFATKRVELAREVTIPAFEFSYQYTLPADWIRTITPHDNDAGVGTLIYKEEDGKIKTSAERVFLRYVYRLTDANAMTADFRRAWSSALARDFALPIAQSGTLQDRFEKIAKNNLFKAKSTDAQAGTPDKRPRGSWVTSRGGRWPRSETGW